MGIDVGLLEGLIGFAGLAVTAIFGYLTARLKASENRRSKAVQEKEEAERELSFQREALGLMELAGEWRSIESEFTRLRRETEIDRVLILKAHNGIQDYRWTTAVHQFRDDDQEYRPYISVELDEDYRGRLYSILKSAFLIFSVRDIPDSEIKAIYEDEGVKASMWQRLYILNMENSESKALFYISYSTHTEEHISDSTKSRCMLVSSRIKALALQHHREEATL